MTKNILFLLFTCFIFTSLFAQIKKIPSEVTEAQKTRYPHAENISWKDKSSSFHAEFTLNGAKMCADFKATGEWLCTERVINFKDMPATVQNSFEKSKYNNWERNIITEHQRFGEPLQYSIDVNKSLEKRKLIFDANGKLLKNDMDYVQK
ncbi:MAG: PepSY-like domain-containing protein [Parafilimonas sp.]